MPVGNGDPLDDYEQRFRQLSALAYNVGLRFFGKHHLAEDVGAETMTRAYVRWNAVRKHENPERWIVRTATNVAHEQSRKIKPRPWPYPQPQSSDDSVGDNLGDAQLIAQAMRKAKLSKRQRDVVAWRFFVDASVEETAAALGISESQVKDATHEAIKKLRLVLGRDLPGLSE